MNTKVIKCNHKWDRLGTESGKYCDRYGLYHEGCIVSIYCVKCGNIKYETLLAKGKDF